MKLGKTDIELSHLGLGCMSISEFYGEPIAEEDGIELIKTAYHEGVNFFDTADAYAFGRNEKLVGKAIAELANEGIPREKIVIATKCGIIRDEHDITKRGVSNKYDYVKACCEASLERLGPSVAYIDLYYLHRVAEGGAQLDEAMRAMAELLDVGKIRGVGLSEATIEMIEIANAALSKYTNGKHQIAALQTEYSLMTRVAETSGVLDFCRKHDITFVAYSPLSRALLTGEVIDPAQQFAENDFRRSLPRFQADNLKKNQLIVNKVSAMAKNKGCTTAQLALAWLLNQSGVVPIPGTTKIKNLKANVASQSVHFTQEELDALNDLEPAEGYRYTESAMKTYGFHDELDG